MKYPLTEKMMKEMVASVITQISAELEVIRKEQNNRLNDQDTKLDSLISKVEARDARY